MAFQNTSPSRWHGHHAPIAEALGNILFSLSGNYAAGGDHTPVLPLSLDVEANSYEALTETGLQIEAWP